MHVLHVVRCFHCERFEFANLYTPIASGFKDWLLSLSCQRALIVKNTQPCWRRKANFSTVYHSLCSALVLFGANKRLKEVAALSAHFYVHLVL